MTQITSWAKCECGVTIRSGEEFVTHTREHPDWKIVEQSNGGPSLDDKLCVALVADTLADWRAGRIDKPATFVQRVQQICGGWELGWDGLLSPAEEARQILDECTEDGKLRRRYLESAIRSIIRTRNRLGGRSVQVRNVATGEVTR